VWLNRNFKKRYDANPSFRHIGQKPKYKGAVQKELGSPLQIKKEVIQCGV
jgi:hypothetical protein